MAEVTGYRKCPNCGKEIKAEATLCGYCWTKSSPMVTSNAADASDGELRASIPESSSLAASSPSPSFDSPQARGVARRYQDAYTVAASIIGQGQQLKATAIVVGFLVALLAVIGAVATARESGLSVAGLVVGLFAAVFIASTIHAHGVRIAAEGQQLLAAIDVAVNTSPFITNTERADIMRL